MLLIAATVLSLLLLYVSLALYVYHDAKTHTDNPTIWLLIALLVPSFFGVLVYIITGRTKKAPSDHKYRLLAIICAVALALSTACTVGCMALAGDLPIIGNVSIGMVSDNIGSHWNVSFRTSGETLNRTLKLTRDEMDSFTVEGSCGSGSSYILLVQDDRVIQLDISDFPKQSVELSGFSEEPFTISLYNNNARDVNVKIDW